MSIPSQPQTGQANANVSSTNQRATVRYQCAPATPGRLLVTDLQEWQRGWLLNLSQSGAGLLLTRSIPSGTHVLLQVKGVADQRLYELAGRVAHASCRNDGDWVIGLELIVRLSDDELDALL